VDRGKEFGGNKVNVRWIDIKISPIVDYLVVFVRELLFKPTKRNLTIFMKCNRIKKLEIRYKNKIVIMEIIR